MKASETEEVKLEDIDLGGFLFFFVWAIVLKVFVGSLGNFERRQ